MVIMHPPCTHLCNSGAKHFAKKHADGRQQPGIDLFMAFTRCSTRRWVIENPVGIMSRLYRKPNQIIQPWQFGDEAQKTTCLWLNNLPPLQHAAEDDMFIKKTHVDKGVEHTFDSGRKMSEFAYKTSCLKKSERGTARSRTFAGIAEAMAEQWGQLK